MTTLSSSLHRIVGNPCDIKYTLPLSLGQLHNPISLALSKWSWSTPNNSIRKKQERYTLSADYRVLNIIFIFKLHRFSSRRRCALLCTLHIDVHTFPTGEFVLLRIMQRTTAAQQQQNNKYTHTLTYEKKN